nr:ABC transporter permease [Paraburkholderia tropica]
MSRHIATPDRPRPTILVFFDTAGVRTAGVVLVVLVLLALAAPLLAPQNPYDLRALEILDARLPPGSKASGTALIYWLGTDSQGRDIFSAILYGLRISLTVGLLSTALASMLGISLGLLAGFQRGRIDALLMRVVDLQLSFPPFLVAIMLLAVTGRGIDKIVIALVTAQWAYYARTARSTVLVEREKDYVSAARLLKLSSARIMFRHILPNCASPLVVVAGVQVAAAIILEATLSFLGVGLPVTRPSLGLLIANGFQYLIAGNYWLSLFPGLTLVVTVLVLNIMADRLRDILDPGRPVRGMI